MIVRFRKFIKENDLFKPTDPILLSVSGGIDSMVMLYLFHREGYKIAVAHCNFTLRGSDSDGDEAFVRDYAESKKIPFYSKRFATKQYAKNHKISIQMAARELRRKWFENLCRQHGFVYYATAHHLNDQTETFFINLFRGTGISGIHGILPKVGNLIHPMMYTWKKDIIRFARIKRIPYRLDKSNLTSDYERNAIRNHLLPAVRQIHPEFEKTLNQNIQSFRKTEMIYRQRINEVVGRIAETTPEKTRISILKLNDLEEASTYLFEILSAFNFNKPVVEDIYKSLSAGSGKTFYSPTHRLIIDREYLIVEPDSSEKPEIPDILIHPSDQKLDSPLHLAFKKYKREADTKVSSDPGVGMFDFDQLRFPLQIRKWQKGDFFYPLGMKNRKLLSDFFIDNKFSLFQKEKTWLLVSDNKIAWVIGHRIDDRFKIIPETRNIYEIKLLSNTKN